MRGILSFLGAGNILSIPRVFIEWLGGYQTAAMMTALLQHEATSAGEDGWFRLTGERIRLECALSEGQYKRVAEKLVEAKLVEKDLREMPAVTYWRIAPDLEDQLNEFLQSADWQEIVREMTTVSLPVSSKRPNMLGQNDPTCSVKTTQQDESGPSQNAKKSADRSSLMTLIKHTHNTPELDNAAKPKPEELHASTTSATPDVDLSDGDTEYVPLDKDGNELPDKGKPKRLDRRFLPDTQEEVEFLRYVKQYSYPDAGWKRITQRILKAVAEGDKLGEEVLLTCLTALPTVPLDENMKTPHMMSTHLPPLPRSWIQDRAYYAKKHNWDFKKLVSNCLLKSSLETHLKNMLKGQAVPSEPQTDPWGERSRYAARM